MEKKRRVVVTGLGAVTPLANNVQETWKKLIEGKSGIGRLTRFNPDDYKAGPKFPRIAGEVRNFDLEKWGVDKKMVRRLERFTQFALAAAIEAVKDAGIENILAKEDRLRIGVQIGVSLGGAEIWEKQCRTLLEEGTERVSPFLIPKLLANMAAANIAIYFGAKEILSPLGPNVSTTTACAAGSHAIGEAFDKIRIGRADLMICGGTEASLTPLAFSGFNNMRALSRQNDYPEKASRPFDKARDGFVMAEGAGIMILEELNHALTRGAKIYGEIIGFGMSSDAHHITEPNMAGPRECMRLTIEDGDISPEEIEYINAHGTATPIGDVNETKAIKDLFGKRAYKLAVSSTKSMTGHLLGGAGGVEAIFTVLALKRGIIPPTINLDDPDPECDLDYVPNRARKKEIRFALSNSFGFGGTNASLVFKKF